MVRSVIIFTLFTLSAHAETIQINWIGSQNSQCQKLVETFLTEFKNVLNDEIIEFDSRNSKANTQNSFELSCDQTQSNLLQINSSNHKFNLHYLGKNAGFDSLDWLAFQRYALRQKTTTPEVNLQANRFDANANNSIESKLNWKSEKQSIWPPVLLGAAVGAVSGAVLSPDDNNRALNTLVFGFVGSTLGSIYSLISNRL